MADPFIGEIRMTGFNFAPRGWAMCSGQLLSIAQNTALFALLGTTYGGNGQTNFALPNLQGRVPIHQGQGAGLSPRFMGEQAGAESHTLSSSEIPPHAHTAACQSGAGNSKDPTGRVWAKDAGVSSATYSNVPPNAQMAPGTISPAGGGQPHNNMQPFLCVNFVIAIQGIFPSRN